MPESRNRKQHKEKVESFKKTKQMEQNQQPAPQQPNQQLPEIREVPIWNSDEVLNITGLEFEYMYNFITSVAQPYAAAQSVMNRGLIDGKIRVEFDKLVTNPDGTKDYVRMTDEESAQHKADFQKLLEVVKNGGIQTPQTKSELTVVS